MAFSLFPWCFFLINNDGDDDTVRLISFSILAGIIKGDEIMVINGAIVSDLDMMFIESVLQEELSLCMMMRSARTGKSESFKVFQSFRGVLNFKTFSIFGMLKLYVYCGTGNQTRSA